MSLAGTLEASATAANVTMTFTVSNAGDAPLEVRFSDACRADFVAQNKDGVECWRFTDGRVFAQVCSSERLGPGETLEETCTWQSPEPGTYTLSASLQARSHECTAERTIIV